MKYLFAVLAVIALAGCGKQPTNNFANTMLDSVEDHELSSGGCVHLPPEGNFTVEIDGDQFSLKAYGEDRDYGNGCNEGLVSYKWCISTGNEVIERNGTDVSFSANNSDNVDICLVISDDDGQDATIKKSFQKQ